MLAMFTLPLKKTIQFYRENKTIILYYILIKIVFFFLFIWGMYLLKNKLLSDNAFIYDFNILKSLDIGDILTLIIMWFLGLLFFVAERNFLIFYFVNKYKNNRISYRKVLKEFILTQPRQSRILFIEILLLFSKFIIFASVVYTLYTLLGKTMEFFIISSIASVVFTYIALSNFLKFIFAIYTFFDEPHKKSPFSYLTHTRTKGEIKQVFSTLIIATLLFAIASAASFVFISLLRQLIYIFTSFHVQVYSLVAISFFETFFFFAVNIFLTIFVFMKFTEIFFHTKLNFTQTQTTTKRKTKKIYILNTVIISLLTLSLLAGYTYTVRTVFHTLVTEDSNKDVFAHRGFSEYYVQNSMEAFHATIGKTNFIELDIQITKDNKLIVFHDENFEDLTGQIGIPSQRTYTEIKAYTVHENKEYLKEEKYAKIPLLEDVMKELSGKIRFAIEIKNTDKSKEKTLASKLVKLIVKYNIENDVIVTSLDYDILKLIKIINPNIKTALILTYSVNSLSQFDVDFYLANSLVNSGKLIKQAHSLQRKIYFWSFEFINDDFKKEYILGADGFVTNNPVSVKNNLEKYEQMPLARKINIIIKDILN